MAWAVSLVARRSRCVAQQSSADRPGTLPRLAWHNAKPDLICPNWKHLHWIIPYRLHCALCAIHRTGNTNTVTNLSRSFSVLFIVLGVGLFADSREHLFGQKIWWEPEVKGDVKPASFECLFTFTFSHLADAFIQSDLQMRTLEAIKTNKRATTCKCNDKSWLA